MHVYVFVFIAASASKQCLFKSCFFALRCSQVYHCFDALIGLQLIINVFFFCQLRRPNQQKANQLMMHPGF